MNAPNGHLADLPDSQPRLPLPASCFLTAGDLYALSFTRWEPVEAFCITGTASMGSSGALRSIFRMFRRGELIDLSQTANKAFLEAKASIDELTKAIAEQRNAEAMAMCKEPDIQRSAGYVIVTVVGSIVTEKQGWVQPETPNRLDMAVTA